MGWEEERWRPRTDTTERMLAIIHFLLSSPLLSLSLSHLDQNLRRLIDIIQSLCTSQCRHDGTRGGNKDNRRCERLVPRNRGALRRRRSRGTGSHRPLLRCGLARSEQCPKGLKGEGHNDAGHALNQHQHARKGELAPITLLGFQLFLREAVEDKEGPKTNHCNRTIQIGTTFRTRHAE